MGLPLIIAGVTLPTHTSILVEQTWSLVDGGGTLLRMASGRAITLSAWKKWATDISVTGWSCAPLLNINTRQPFSLSCVQPLSLLPGEDLPEGWEVRAGTAPIDVVDPHDGRAMRLVYPVLTVVSESGFSFRPGGDTSWSIRCEEV